MRYAALTNRVDAMILPQLDRDKVNLDLPLFTLDVNQVALRDPAEWPEALRPLSYLEWNYFETEKVELCVTPVTAFEITKGESLADLPYTAYRRFQKSQFFKSRPSGTTLQLSRQEGDVLWGGTRDILWPTVDDGSLTVNQRSDVNQLFYHTIASGSTCSNAAFVTLDTNFLDRRDVIMRDLGVTIVTPSEAWDQYNRPYDLYHPSPAEIQIVFDRQQGYLESLSTQSCKGL